MGTVSWIIVSVMMFFLGFFTSAIFFVAGRDEAKEIAYRQGINEGMRKQ